MSAKTIDHTTTLNILECAECCVLFAIPARMEKSLRDSHKIFYCPLGHNNYFPDKSEAEKLREELERERKKSAWEAQYSTKLREQRDRIQASLSATRGVVTRLKKRAVAGICPCCNRHFTALERHMASRHPDYIAEDAAEAKALIEQHQGGR